MTNELLRHPIFFNSQDISVKITVLYWKTREYRQCLTYNCIPWLAWCLECANCPNNAYERWGGGGECKVVERSEVWRKWATTTTTMSLSVSLWVNVYEPSMTSLKCQNMNGKEDKYCSLPPYLEMWKFINLELCPSYVTITRISAPCYQIGYRSQDTRIKRISIYHLSIWSINQTRKKIT